MAPVITPGPIKLPLSKENDMAKVAKRGPKVQVWTPENDKMLRKHFPTMRSQELADMLGLTLSAVRNRAMILRLKKDGAYWQHGQEKFILKNWNVMSAEELAEQVGKTKWAVINKYRELTGKRGKK